MGEPASFVYMPKAPVYKDDFLSCAKHQIRSSRQTRATNSIAITQGVNDPPDAKLGLGVTALDRAHYLGSFFLGEVIHRAFPNVTQVTTAV